MLCRLWLLYIILVQYIKHIKYKLNILLKYQVIQL